MENSSVDYELIVSPDEAADGTRKLLKINGRQLEVSIPAGVKTGTIVKLRNALNYGDTLLIRIRIEVEGEAVNGEVHRVTPVRPTRTKPRIPTWGKWAIGIAVVGFMIAVVIPNLTPSSQTPPATTAPMPTPVPKRTPISLPTGTYLMKNIARGLGELKIINGLDLDAVVLLSRLDQPGIPAVAVYIRAGASHTITGISDGGYVVYFNSGQDWDNDLKRFIENARIARFKDNFDFSTSSKQYTIYEVTLNPVIGGTAEIEYLKEGEFPVLVP